MPQKVESEKAVLPSERGHSQKHKIPLSRVLAEKQGFSRGAPSEVRSYKERAPSDTKSPKERVPSNKEYPRKGHSQTRGAPPLRRGALRDRGPSDAVSLKSPVGKRTSPAKRKPGEPGAPEAGDPGSGACPALTEVAQLRAIRSWAPGQPPAERSGPVWSRPTATAPAGGA